MVISISWFFLASHVSHVAIYIRGKKYKRLTVSVSIYFVILLVVRPLRRPMMCVLTSSNLLDNKTTSHKKSKRTFVLAPLCSSTECDERRRPVFVLKTFSSYVHVRGCDVSTVGADVLLPFFSFSYWFVSLATCRHINPIPASIHPFGLSLWIFAAFRSIRIYRCNEMTENT